MFDIYCSHRVHARSLPVFRQFESCSPAACCRLTASLGVFDSGGFRIEDRDGGLNRSMTRVAVPGYTAPAVQAGPIRSSQTKSKQAHLNSRGDQPN